MMTSPLTSDATLSFPKRLRAERKRLAISQVEFGRLGGVSKAAQWLYEAGKNWPTVEYLETLKSNGVDVVFLVTGNRSMNDRLDWTILRHAFLFVQLSLANRLDRQFTPDQLFDAFKSVVETSLEMTRPDIASQKEHVSIPTEKAGNEC